jgi:voltage-gated potassium channel
MDQASHSTASLPPGPARRLVGWLRELYEGASPDAHRFRYGLLFFDVVTVVFIVGTSFIPRMAFVEVLDVIIGIGILLDVAARIAISDRRLKVVLSPITLVDFVAIASFLAPVTGEAAGFLRVVRTLRLLHSYQLLARLRADSPCFRANEEVVFAIANLFVFIFVMTGVVYETQHWTNPNIRNYADALYFTITALTTTGFGDITLTGTSGRMISVVIMIFGVTLFLRLAQVLFRPHKVRFPCPTCGLQRHDSDAVHCKACGTVLNIPDEGD